MTEYQKTTLRSRRRPEPEAQIAAFIKHYNRRRYQESFDNLTHPTSASGAARWSAPYFDPVIAAFETLTARRSVA